MNMCFPASIAFLSALSLTNFSKAGELTPACTLYFVRGHGGSVLSRSEILQKEGFKVLGLGCYIEDKADTIAGAPKIHGYVGDWMSGLRPDYNGGLIPRLTESESLDEDYRYLSRILDAPRPAVWAVRIGPPLPRAKTMNELITEMQAVGFEKLQQERWMRGLAHAVSEVAHKKCAEFRIQIDADPMLPGSIPLEVSRNRVEIHS